MPTAGTRSNLATQPVRRHKRNVSAVIKEARINTGSLLCRSTHSARSRATGVCSRKGRITYIGYPAKTRATRLAKNRQSAETIVDSLFGARVVEGIDIGL